MAAAAAALAVLPVLARAQRVVNHLMYGQRDEPASALAALGERLQAVMLPTDVADATVHTIARSLRVPHVGLDIADEQGGMHPVAEHGTPLAPVHAEPLLHHGVVVGRLRVSSRGREDPLESADLALVRSLARQVGPAVQAVRLHADLVRARAAVVTLREEERRRLRRDLHDGIGPVLATIALKAGLAARTVPDGPARELLGQIGTEVASGLGDVRRLAEELRPPAIDELGVVGAVRRRAEALSGTMDVEVSAPADRLTLPAAVESAAYGIAVEAMTNAVRHSGGSHVSVSIEVAAPDLVVLVRDDGSGLAPDRVPGVGLRSMRERAEELGGRCEVRSAGSGTEVPATAGPGTEVWATIPLAPGTLR
jgi:signal transduction histidine kinase